MDNRRTNIDWDQYPDMLKPEHVKEILNIGRGQTFQILGQKNPPFRVERFGPKTIRVPKPSIRHYIEQG